MLIICAHCTSSVQELIDNNEAHFADAGGFVSPNGTSYIGVSKKKLGKVGSVPHCL